MFAYALERGRCGAKIMLACIHDGRLREPICFFLPTERRLVADELLGSDQNHRPADRLVFQVFALLAHRQRPDRQLQSGQCPDTALNDIAGPFRGIDSLGRVSCHIGTGGASAVWPWWSSWWREAGLSWWGCVGRFCHLSSHLVPPGAAATISCAAAVA